ncbi:hypothetical protein [Rhizobium sp. IBUN]|uniref:hypothetical protein n=1 Tax=Rhizobium sp. IBUN TaxID=1042326 RepID=UPI0012EBE4A8|nr:hypothetical protein [Rhizobium sp. IBUN]
MQAQDCYRWLRWFVLDHALLLVIIAMITTIFSVFLYQSGGGVSRRDFHWQRSIDDRL